MSKLTQCNYCTLKSIHIRAKQDKSRVYLIPWKDGTDIYVVEKGDKLDTRKNKTGGSIGKQWVCWFMQIGSSCGC